MGKQEEAAKNPETYGENLRETYGYLTGARRIAAAAPAFASAAAAAAAAVAAAAVKAAAGANPGGQPGQIFEDSRGKGEHGSGHAVPDNLA